MRKLIVVESREQIKNDGQLYAFVDWDNDGVLHYEGEQTLKQYHQIKEGTYHHKFEGVFFAFSNDQFREGCKSIGIDPDSDLHGVIYRSVGGCYGTRKGLDAMYKFYESVDEQIKTVCDPQEVYLYEYNNHEGCINFDGDAEAVELIIDTWGADVARELVRFRAMYTIDEIIERNKR